jgi:hypothetical protein
MFAGSLKEAFGGLAASLAASRKPRASQWENAFAWLDTQADICANDVAWDKVADYLRDKDNAEFIMAIKNEENRKRTLIRPIAHVSHNFLPELDLS